jgi:hypothetical protein
VIINCGYYKRVHEQAIDADYPRNRVDRCSFFWDAVVLGLVPFVVKHEYIRLISIKD